MSARHRKPRSRNIGGFSALLGLLVVAALAGSGGTYAAWNSATTLGTGATIKSANPALTVTGFSDLAYTFTNTSQGDTATITIRNSGDIALTGVRTSAAVTAGNTNVANNLSFRVWTPSVAPCTATANPSQSSQATGLAALSQSIGNLAAGTTFSACVRSTASNLSTRGNVTIALSATGSVTGTSWTAAGAQSVSQTIASSDTTAPTHPWNGWGPWTGTITATSIELGWSAANDNVAVTDYEIYRNGTLIGTSGGATGYVDRNLRAGATYTYFLKARDAAGNVSTPSASISPTTSNLLGWNPSSKFRINNVQSGLCLELGSLTNGTALKQQPCATDGTSSQTWVFNSAAENTYWIMPKNGSPIGWDVNVDFPNSNRGMNDYTPVQGWSYGGTSNQQWRLEQTTAGNFRIVSVLSGKCLDVPNARTDPGLQLQQYTCNGTNAQNFTLTGVPG